MKMKCNTYEVRMNKLNARVFIERITHYITYEEPVHFKLADDWFLNLKKNEVSVGGYDEENGVWFDNISISYERGETINCWMHGAGEHCVIRIEVEVIE